MVSGAVFGGLIASEGLVSYFTQDAIGISGTWTLLMGGVLLLLNLVFVPEGIAGSQYKKRKQKQLARQRVAAPPSTPSSPVAATVAGGDR
jgi:hypothetical protein